MCTSKQAPLAERPCFVDGAYFVAGVLGAGVVGPGGVVMRVCGAALRWATPVEARSRGPRTRYRTKTTARTPSRTGHMPQPSPSRLMLIGLLTVRLVSPGIVMIILLVMT